MKRIVTFIVTLIFLVCLCSSLMDTSALSSPSPETIYIINVSTNGSGEAISNKQHVLDGETVTLVASDLDSEFDHWEIKGNYVFIRGSVHTKEITIEPFSDVNIVAKFKNGKEDFTFPSYNKDSTSPQTGHSATSIYLILTLMCIACGGVMFSVYKVNKR